MKQFVAVYLFVLILGANAAAQGNEASSFVIDQSKPYVYLKFDHIGPRTPRWKGETNTGIWLKVVNNCRVPIVLSGFDATAGESGVGLLDEVIETEPHLEITDKSQNELDARRRQKMLKLKQKPSGYSDETPGVVRIQPGKEVLFSVPRNHVSDVWYMRVKFALDVHRSAIAVGPFTYLPFHEWDIPENGRK